MLYPSTHQSLLKKAHLFILKSDFDKLNIDKLETTSVVKDAVKNTVYDEVTESVTIQ